MRAGFTPVLVRHYTGCAKARFGAQRQRLTLTSWLALCLSLRLQSVIPEKGQRVIKRANNVNLLTRKYGHSQNLTI